MWRFAIIQALYKGKGDRSCAGSYGQISLTDIANKYLKRIVADQIREFLNKNHLLGNEQHGFRE